VVLEGEKDASLEAEYHCRQGVPGYLSFHTCNLENSS
jgi:hypothetical protein